MSEEEIKSGYRVIQDVTEKVIERGKRIFSNPDAVRILSAKLMLGPDGWGGYAYFIELKYEIDGVQYRVTKQVVADINEVLMHLLDDIESFYERMHNIKL